MAKTSAIEWTDATWNPWMGCTKVSEGCKNCYASRDMKRFGRDFPKITRSKTTFRAPLKWIKPRMIFVCSWSDFFHEDVPREWRNQAWWIMEHTRHHTYLLLTKRPENIPDMLPSDWCFSWNTRFKNVWIGVSAENQERADERIPKLLDIRATKHFVSAEPLLGPIDFIHYIHDIDWIITGGESDFHNPRPMDLSWVGFIRDHCIGYGVSFFHKQHGGSKKINGAWGGRELDGRTWDEFPDENKTGFFCPKCGTVYKKIDGVLRGCSCNP
jgi:protein gp37